MTLAISKRDKCLLLGLFGGLFLLLAWLYVASPLQEKTEALQTENIALKSKAELYQAINANLATYEEGIVKMERKIAEIANSYPIYISREDEILFLANMENTYHSDVAIENITMSAVEEVVANVQTAVTEETQVAEDGTTVAETPAVITPEIHMYRQPVNYSFRCTYKGAKDMITYLYAQTEKKCIEGVTLGFDASTGNLMGTVDLNQYYMTGIDKNYQPTGVPAVPKGVRDVFHTLNGAAGVDSATGQN